MRDMRQTKLLNKQQQPDMRIAGCSINNNTKQCMKGCCIISSSVNKTTKVSKVLNNNNNSFFIYFKRGDGMREKRTTRSE